MILKTLNVLMNFLLITSVFYFASGSLSPRRLNLVNITYYEYVIMVYLGSAVCYLGFGKAHYIVGYLSDSLLQEIFYIVVATGMAVPIIIVISDSVLGERDIPGRLRTFYERPAIISLDLDKLYRVVSFFSIIGTICMFYTFSSLHTIPLLDVIRNGSSNSASIRWSAGNEFGGNIYIRNLGMLTLVPINSIVSFIVARLTGEQRWKRLTILTTAVAFVSLTWNLEKAPVVYHLVYMYIASCMTSNGRSSIIPYLVSSLLLIALGYYVTSGSLPTLALTSGPIGRTILTTNGTLALHYHYFPNYHPFLQGTSLPTIVARILGLRAGWQRSSAIVMALFNPRGIESHTAGVMNAFFIGEAYANWGMTGTVLSVVLVALFIAFANRLVLSSSKTVITILCAIILIKFHVTSMLGGVVDYIYSMSLLFSLLYAYLLYSLCRAKS